MHPAPGMRHTYLFEPARWEAAGTFTDGSGNILPAEGFTLVLHGGNRWFIEGKMRVPGGHPPEITSNCAVIPFPENSCTTRWTSRHPDLGRLAGRLVVIGDTFFSFFNSQDGRHNGSEWLRQISAGAYENRGVVFAGDRLISAWAVTLQRRE